MREIAVSAVVANATKEMVRLGLLAFQNVTNVTNQPSPTSKSDDSSLYAAIGGGTAAAVALLGTVAVFYRNRASLKNCFVGMFKSEPTKANEESGLLGGAEQDNGPAVTEKKSSRTNTPSNNGGEARIQVEAPKP